MSAKNTFIAGRIAAPKPGDLLGVRRGALQRQSHQVEQQFFA
jgi:hypothetical protein